MLLAEPISRASTQYMDFVEIFNISLDLSTIYLLVLVGVVSSCYSILECYNLFSGVKLSIRLFYFISSEFIGILTTSKMSNPVNISSIARIHILVARDDLRINLEITGYD